MNIRSATLEDQPMIIDIMNQAILSRSNAYLEPMGDVVGAHWFQKLYSNAAPLLVIMHGQALAGFGMLTAYRHGRGALAKVKELSFYIHSDHHRRGLARRLIHQLELEATAQETTHLVAILLGSNLKSYALLTKLGYEEEGRLKGIATFSDAKTDHVFMVKSVAT